MRWPHPVAPSFLVGVVLAAAACAVDFAPVTPAGAVLTCGSNADCPSALPVCDLDVGQCVSDRATAPTASLELTPAFARDGVTVLVDLHASTALRATPELRFNPTLSLAAVGGQSGPGTDFAYTLFIDEGVLDGVYRFVAADLVSSDGGRGSAQAPLQLVIDRAAPELSDLTVVPNTGAVLTDVPGLATTTLGLVASDSSSIEGIDVLLGRLKVDEDNACARTATDDAVAFTCSFEIEAGEVNDGLNDVRVLVRDAAGNQAERLLVVSIDAAPPQVVPGSTEIEVVAPPGTLPLVPGLLAASTGSVVDVQWLLNEENDGDPQVAFVQDDATTPATVAFAPVLPRLPGGPYRFRAVLGVDVPDGRYRIEAQLKDVLGHRTTAVLVSAITLQVDTPSSCVIPARANGDTCTDVDGDGQFGASVGCGAPAALDCNDANPLVALGAVEIPGDGVANDCGVANRNADLPIDESTGVFVDAAAPDGGDGTRSSPFNDLDTAHAAALLHPSPTFIYAAAGDLPCSTTLASLAVSVIGGLNPLAQWTRANDANGRPLVGGTHLLGNSPSLRPLESNEAVFESLTIDEFASLSATTAAVRMRHLGGLQVGSKTLFVDCVTDDVRVRAAGADTRFVDSFITNNLNVEARGVVLVRTVVSDVTEVFAGATLEAASSRLRAPTRCTDCLGLNLAHVFSTGVSSTGIVVSGAGAEIHIVNSFFELLGTAPRLLDLQEGNAFTVRGVQFSAAVGGGDWLTLRSSTGALLGSVTQTADFSSCAQLETAVSGCRRLESNTELVERPFDGDGALRLDAVAPLNAGVDPFPDAPRTVALDRDGQCRFLDAAPDIGPDER